MKAVGIKVLKDNLSKYLKMVTAGETIWVTDRDEVIAEIHRPTLPIPGKISKWEAFLNDEERRGSLKRAAALKTPSLRRLRDIPRPEKVIDLQKLLDDIKGD
jgi:antitoxin (DNA-binding transcriptional repressor) of toxin-antitoxin stability system